MAPVRSGDGSAGNPWRLTTAFNAQSHRPAGPVLLQVSEVVRVRQRYG